MLFEKPKVGIALAGGGAKGLAHIGVLKYLKEQDIRIDTIAGTSIGAIVGGVYSLNPDVSFLEIKARKLVDSEVFQELGLDKFSKEHGGWFTKLKNKLRSSKIIAETFFKYSLLPKDKTEKIFKSLFGKHTFKEVRIPFAAVALDLYSGEDVIIKEGFLWKAAQASAAIPGIFPPVKMGKKLLVDGGVTANVPINACIELGADVVIAVVFGKEPSPPGDIDTAMEVILRSDELAKLKLFRMLLDRADVVVEVNLKELHWTDFSEIDFCIEKGIEAAKRSLKKIKEVLKRRYLWRKKLFGR